MQTLRLTSFSHGGGCGCKIAPGDAVPEVLRHFQREGSDEACVAGTLQAGTPGVEVAA